MGPSFHFQTEIPVAFYCLSTFLTANHQPTNFLLAPLSSEPHLYGAINPHVTGGRCHWRSLPSSQRCLSLKTSLQYFEFTPTERWKTSVWKPWFGFCLGVEKESGPRCACGSVTENSLSHALVPLFGAEPPRAGSGEKSAGRSHPPEDRGHFKDIVTGEMVRVIKLSVKCSLPGLAAGCMAGESEKSQPRGRGGGPGPGPVALSSLHTALVSCPQPVPGSAPGPWVCQGAAVTLGREAGRDGALKGGRATLLFLEPGTSRPICWRPCPLGLASLLHPAPRCLLQKPILQRNLFSKL